MIDFGGREKEKSQGILVIHSGDTIFIYSFIHSGDTIPILLFSVFAATRPKRL
jgi:hypothetical protein